MSILNSIYDATKQDNEPGANKRTLTSGEVVYEKNKKYYDEMHHQIPFREIKGMIKNGPCGHPTCTAMYGALWRDSSLKDKLVCSDCAKEKNERAKGTFGSETKLPCIREE